MKVARLVSPFPPAGGVRAFHRAMPPAATRIARTKARPATMRQERDERPRAGTAGSPGCASRVCFGRGEIPIVPFPADEVFFTRGSGGGSSSSTGSNRGGRPAHLTPGFEGRAKIAATGVSILRLLRYGLEADFLQAGVEVGAPLGGPGRRRVDDIVEQDLDRAALERQVLGQQLVQGDAGAVLVGGGADVSAPAWPPPWATWSTVTASANAVWRRSPRTSSMCRSLWARWRTCQRS